MALRGDWQAIYRCCSTRELIVQQVHLSPDGIATIVAAPADISKIGFCSVLLGVDCHTLHVACCYCLDEAVDGAAFDADRERVAVWTHAGPSDRIALHVFALRDAWSSSFLHRFRVDRRAPGQRLMRVAWAHNTVALWVGLPHERWDVSTACLHRAAGTGEQQQASLELDASGMGSEWERPTPVVATGCACSLNECELSADASWALLHPDASGLTGWACLHLHGERGSVPTALAGCEAACFGMSSTERSCELFVVQRAHEGERGAADATSTLAASTLAASEAPSQPERKTVAQVCELDSRLEMWQGTISSTGSGLSRLRRLEMPWLTPILRTPAGSIHSSRMSVRQEAASGPPIALWMMHRASAGGTSAGGALMHSSMAQGALVHGTSTAGASLQGDSFGHCIFASAHGASVKFPVDATGARMALSPRGMAALHDGMLYSHLPPPAAAASLEEEGEAVQQSAAGGHAAAAIDRGDGSAAGGDAAAAIDGGDGSEPSASMPTAARLPASCASRAIHWCGSGGASAKGPGRQADSEHASGPAETVSE